MIWITTGATTGCGTNHQKPGGSEKRAILFFFFRTWVSQVIWTSWVSNAGLPGTDSLWTVHCGGRWKENSTRREECERKAFVVILGEQKEGQREEIKRQRVQVKVKTIHRRLQNTSGPDVTFKHLKYYLLWIRNMWNQPCSRLLFWQ